MDVVYMNELLEKRRSHGMNYFGKKKIRKNNLRTKQTLENTKKCFSENFFKNATKHRKYFSEIIFYFQKIFFGNYFLFLENIFQKLFSENYFTAKQTHPKLS